MKYLLRSINDLKEKDIQFIKEKYPVRYQKASLLKHEDDFKRSILAYVLLIELIGDFNELDISYNEFNKPFIKNKPEFNISHSGEYAAVVIDDNPVGIDIQKIDEKNLKLKTLFTEKEQKYIDEKDSINRFHEVWSIKEAAIKYLGTGLTTPFKKVEILDNENIRVDSITFKYEKRIANGYCLCICYK